MARTSGLVSVAAVSEATQPADEERLRRLYLFLSVGAAGHVSLPDTWAPPWMLTYVIGGQPETKVRHRNGPGGAAYADRDASRAEKATAKHLAVMVAGRGGPLLGNLALGCVFFRGHRGHIDADNMVKHVCDAGNGVAWADDTQITAQLGVVEYDPTRPRTLIVVGPHYSSMDRGGVAAARPAPANRGQRGKRRNRGYGYGKCGCGRTISAALTHCGECRRKNARVVSLDKLF